MASDRDTSGSLIDIAAVVVSPALVMLMVGSLTFFLITVLYQGAYPDRLLYTFFVFVFGAVLIARISIQFGRARAGLYAAGLGGACFLAMMAFVKYPSGIMATLGPVLNLGLMALVWWAADKLTWDCTHFDDDRKASGKGVLAAAGLDQESGVGSQESDEEEAKPKRRGKKPVGWLEKFQAYREQQRKKAHTPGVWVLYFALAALPLFALGQSLIDPADTATRRATLWQMAVYVGSGLGLLVTTTLFGLKRYLEQRNARIPPVMVGGWLGLGAGLIVVFLAVGMALPRPHSETPWFGLKRTHKADRDASRYAVVKDGSAGKGEGAAGKKTEAGEGKNSARGGEKGGNAGEKGSGGGKGKSQGGNQKGGEKGNDSGNQTGEGQDQSKNDRGQKNGPNKKPDQKSGERAKAKSSEQQAENNGGRQESRDDEQGQDADKNQSDDGSSSGSDSSSPSRLGDALEKVGSFVKWIVWIVVAVAVVVGIAVFVLRYLAPFTDWARNLLDWLKGLFARKPKRERLREDEDGGTDAEVERPPPFSAFDNPFADGTARRRDPAELVEYTFAAFDAWAWDRDRGREPGETPLEFAIRVGHDYADLDEPGFRLANLYVRVLYSRSPLPGDTRKTLAEFWDHLEAAPARSA
jgi:hypothetical protein